jgi:hypothetical protein
MTFILVISAVRGQHPERGSGSVVVDGCRPKVCGLGRDFYVPATLGDPWLASQISVSTQVAAAIFDHHFDHH